jgi:hypothetical protein
MLLDLHDVQSIGLQSNPAAWLLGAQTMPALTADYNIRQCYWTVMYILSIPWRLVLMLEMLLDNKIQLFDTLSVSL